MGLTRTAARRSLEARDASPPLQLKESDMTLGESRGWTIISGTRQDGPVTFADLVTQGWRRNPAVAACIRLIQDSIGDAKLHAYSPTSDGELEKIDDESHPAVQIIRRPNPRDGGIPFFTRSIQHYLLGGNTLWRKVRAVSRLPVRLFTIRPDMIQSAYVDDDGVPIDFKVRVSETSGKIILLPAEDSVLIPDVDPMNDVFGTPRLLAAGLETATDNQASMYVSETLGNHGVPSILVGMEKGIRGPQLDEAEERWEEKFGPGRGRGKAGFVSGLQSVHEIGFTLQELEFPDLRNIARESICAVFGVDPIMVGLGSASRGGSLSGTEYKESRRKLWIQTIIPLLRRWEDALNFFLAPEFGDIRYGFDLAGIEALREDRDKAFGRADKMKTAGTYTPQEIRTETGHDPEPDPEQETIIQGTGTVVVPVEDVFTPPEPILLPTDSGLFDEDEDEEEEDEE